MRGQQAQENMLNAFERTSCKLIPAALLALVLHSARAQDANAPAFSFSGFGTLSEVHSSEDKADFTSTTFKPNGAGSSNDWSAGVDSLIAAQVTANFTPQLSAVVQVISEENFDNSYRPHVEWANIKYQFTPDFSVRVGRTALPVFMVSDSREIGYANPWVRPPIEVYNLVPITSNDGVDASYRIAIGAATNTFQLTAGQSDSKFPAATGIGAGTAQARAVRTFVDTFEHGSATVHFNYGQTRLTIPEFAPLFDAFRQFGPEGIAIADKYAVDKRLVTFLGMSATYDPGKWFVMGEWGRVNTHSVLGESTGWYGTGGYRFGKITPYLTYAQVKADSNRSDPGLTVSALPPSLGGPATGLNAVLNSVLGSIAVQNTVSVGGRWDFAKSAALKLQLDHINLGAGSAGTLVDLQPGFQPGGKLNVVSVTIDFVF
jgi:hypothetical protein